MGRALLLIVAGLSLVGLTYTFTSGGADGATADNQVDAQHAALAQTAARGGFDAALHAILADPASRPSVTDRPAAADGDYGHFDVRSGDTAQGAVDLVAEGRYQNTGYVIEANVLQLLPLGAGVFLNAEHAKVELKDDAFVSGLDRRVPGTGSTRGGPAGARPALAFRDNALRDEVLADWDDSGLHLEGAGPSAVIPPPAAMVQIVDAVIADPTTDVRTELKLENAVLGSPVLPVAVYVTDDAELGEGAVGYGLLIVDGDFKMEEDARWEGVVVVRANSTDKRKVQLTDDASVFGSLVLLGVEYLVEGTGSEGFPGGHMDLDLFEGAGAPLDRAYHQHEWDDRYDLTYLDFLAGPDIGPAFTAFRDANLTRSLRVEFVNANNAAGTYSIGSAVSPATGRIEDGFSATVPFATLSTLRLDFDGLCTLRGTSPGRVKGAGGDRDRAFTVRFWDGATLVYAVSAYEHAKLLRDGDPACASGSGTTTAVDAYGEFDFKMEGDAAVYYSEEAAGRVARGVPGVRGHTRTHPVFLRSVPVPR